MNRSKLLLFFCFFSCLSSLSMVAQTRTAVSQDSILKFDFDAMHVGVAENDEGPTGTTVFYFPKGVMGAADIRGGATGTVNAHVVTRGYERNMIDAVVFSGGSWYGLSAATGVANGIKDLKAKEGDSNFIAGVLGGIIYDVGGRRYSRVTPDDQLGRDALFTAKPNRFPMGASGAGRFAMQGSYFFANNKDSASHYARWPHSGQGAAFAQIGEIKIAVFTVVNAVGAIVDRDGKVVRCHRNSSKGDCTTISQLYNDTELIQDLRKDSTKSQTTNTTLTLVVTNLKLPYWALERLAKQVHTSMGRAIQPFSTRYDGDVLYAVTTNEVDDPHMDPLSLSVAASELAWDAILNSVPKIPELPQPLPANHSSDLQSYQGSYIFNGGGKLTVTCESNELKAEYSGYGGIYFNEGRIYDLIPATNGLFIIDTPAKDVIRFNKTKEENVSGLTLNPGRWSMEAFRD